MAQDRRVSMEVLFIILHVQERSSERLKATSGKRKRMKPSFFSWEQQYTSEHRYRTHIRFRMSLGLLWGFLRIKQFLNWNVTIVLPALKGCSSAAFPFPTALPLRIQTRNCPCVHLLWRMAVSAVVTEPRRIPHRPGHTVARRCWIRECCHFSLDNFSVI